MDNDLYAYVAAVKARLPGAVEQVAAEAARWPSRESDKLGAMQEALGAALEAAAENDLAAYAAAMRRLAGIATAELAAAETPGTVLSVGAE